MIGRLCLLLYRVVGWRARLLPAERGYALRARWALRLYPLTTGGLDDDFAAELFELIRQMPALLDELDQQASGTNRGAREKRQLLGVLRQAQASGAQSLY